MNSRAASLLWLALLLGCQRSVEVDNAGKGGASAAAVTSGSPSVANSTASATSAQTVGASSSDSSTVVSASSAVSGSATASSATATSAASTASSSGAGGACGDTTTDPLNCGACGHDCLGGACVGSMCRPVVVDQITFDPVYFFTVNATDIYINRGGAGVSRKALSGGPEQDLYSGDLTSSIALDSSNVYWNAYDGVLSQPLFGGPITTLFPIDGVGADGLVVDATNAYFVLQDNEAPPVLRKVALVGGASSVLATWTDGIDPTLCMLDLDDSNVFLARDYLASSDVVKVPKAGGVPVVLATPTLQPICVTHDTENVYWTNAMSAPYGTVQFVSKAGGPVTTLSGLDGPVGITADDTYVYWVSSPGIQRMPLGGGPITMLVTAPAAGGYIAQDSVSIFWNFGDKILRVAK